MSEPKIEEIPGEDALLFYVEFIDGTSFKKIIGFLRKHNTTANFYFRKEVISYSRSNEPLNSILDQVYLDPNELASYKYCSPDEVVVVGVNLTNFEAHTKKIGSNEGLRLFQLKGNPRLYIEKISNSRGGRTNVNYIMTIIIPVDVCHVEAYSRGEENPNCVIPSKQLGTMCKNLSSITCNKIRIRAFDRGIVLDCVVEGDRSGASERFGEIEAPSHLNVETKVDLNSIFGNISGNNISVGKITIDTPCDYDILISMSTLKSLQHFSGLCPTGVVKVYAEPGKPLKFTTKISSYGEANMYLKHVGNK